MFMIPIPPTTSTVGREAGEETPNTWVACLLRGQEARCWFRIMEVVIGAGTDLVLPPEDPLHVDHPLLERYAVGAPGALTWCAAGRCRNAEAGRAAAESGSARPDS